MDGWNTNFLLGWPIFRCEMLVCRQGNSLFGLTLIHQQYQVCNFPQWSLEKTKHVQAYQLRHSSCNHWAFWVESTEYGSSVLNNFFVWSLLIHQAQLTLILFDNQGFSFDMWPVDPGYLLFLGGGMKNLPSCYIIRIIKSHTRIPFELTSIMQCHTCRGVDASHHLRCWRFPKTHSQKYHHFFPSTQLHSDSPSWPWLFTGVFPVVFPAVSGLEGFSKKKIHPRALWALRCWEDFPGRISSGDWGSWCIPTVQAGFTKAWDHGCLGGVGFKYFLFSPRSLRKWSNLTNIFQMDWNHQQAVFWWCFVVDTLGISKILLEIWWVWLFYGACCLAPLTLHTTNKRYCIRYL